MWLCLTTLLLVHLMGHIISKTTTQIQERGCVQYGDKVGGRVAFNVWIWNGMKCSYGLG